MMVMGDAQSTPQLNEWWALSNGYHDTTTTSRQWQHKRNEWVDKRREKKLRDQIRPSSAQSRRKDWNIRLWLLIIISFVDECRHRLGIGSAARYTYSNIRAWQTANKEKVVRAGQEFVTTPLPRPLCSSKAFCYVIWSLSPTFTLQLIFKCLLVVATFVEIMMKCVKMNKSHSFILRLRLRGSVETPGIYR